MGWGWGKEVPEKGETHIYLQLIHLVVWQKPTLHCKAITLQFKKSITLKKEVSFKEPHPISPEVGVPPLHAGAAPPAGGWPVSPGGSAVHHLQGLSPAVPGPWPEGVPTGRGCSEVKVEGLLQGCHAGRRSLLYTDTPMQEASTHQALCPGRAASLQRKGPLFFPTKALSAQPSPRGLHVPGVAAGLLPSQSRRSRPWQPCLAQLQEAPDGPPGTALTQGAGSSPASFGATLELLFYLGRNLSSGRVAG